MSSMSTARPCTLRDGSTPSSPNLNWMIVSAVLRTVPSSFTLRSSRALIRRRCMYPDRDVRATEDLHRLDLEGLLEGSAGHLFQLSALVRVHEAFDLLDRGPEGVRDLLLRLLGDVLVIDARRETADHDRADRHLRPLVDEDPCGVRSIIPRELVEDLAFEGADPVLVDRARHDDALLDHDEGVFLLEFLEPDVPLRGDRRLERHAQVLRQDRGEEGLPRPELLAAFLDVRRREIPDVDLGQDERDLLAGELAILVREQERPRDVVVDAADHGPAEPRGEDVFLHAHEHAGLRAGLLALQDVQVHLVP